jgi:transposase
MPYLSDRQRREIGVLPRIIYVVITQEGALAEAQDGEDARLIDAMGKVCLEPLEGLDARHATKIARQTTETARRVVWQDLHDAPNAKVIAIVWHVLAHLTATGYLEIHEGSPMAEAAEILEPSFQHVYSSPERARSIDKQARRFLERLQAEGLYRGVPAMGEMEVA